MKSRRWLLRGGVSAAVVGPVLACGSETTPPEAPAVDTGYDGPGAVPGGPWGAMPAVPEFPDEGGEPGEGRRRRGERERKPAPAPSKPSPKPSPAGGIRAVGDDRWEVDRRKVKSWKADPNSIGAGAAKKGNGWEITSVRGGSDAEALGARKGDVITSVNGKSLASTTDLLQVLAMLESQSSFKVKLTRGGQAKEHGYRLVSE